MLKRPHTKKKFFILFAAVILVFLGAFGSTVKYYTQSSCNSDRTNIIQLMAFVNRAEESVKQKGQEAFNDFRDKNGKWVSGTNYIFAYDMDGNTVVLPLQPELEGTNRMAAMDSEGKYFVKEMVDILKLSDSGWLEYKYAKPGKDGSSTKLSYFQKVKVAGKEYFVGSGIYLD